MAIEPVKDDDDEFEKMDEESLDYLEQIRKGNDRNFVLSMKDSKVRSLLVKKKPLNDKDRKSARGGGYVPVFGVAAGGGASITFYVARTDGFDEKTVECKTDKLKKFLKEQTGKPVNPEFVLLETPRPIPFDENDLKDPLVIRFQKLSPTIEKACAASPGDAARIRSTTEDIRGLLLDDETRTQAKPKLDEFESYLSGLLSAGDDAATTSTTTTSTTTESATETGAEQLLAAMSKLTPAIKQAATTHLDRKAEILGPVAKFHEQIGAGDLAQARESLRQVAKVLASLSTQKPTPTQSQATATTTDDSAQQAWEARWGKLESAYLDALRSNRPDADKLRVVAGYAQEQAGAGQYAKALAALDRLEPLLIAAPPTDGAGRQNVFIDALRRWKAAQGKIEADFAAFRKAVLADEAVQTDPRLRFVSAALDEMPNMLPAGAEKVEAALGAVEPTSDALEALKQYRGALDSSAQLEKLEALATESFGETLAVRDTLRGTLDEIESLIQGAA